MCDPVSLAIASTVATGVGAVGSISSSMDAASAAKKQAANVRAWQQEQKRNRDASFAKQEALRAEADRSRVAGLEQLSGEAQGTRQAKEEERLAEALNTAGERTTPEAGTPVSVADASIAPPQASDTYKSDLAAAINTATTGARQRMKALAGITSFGSGSTGALGATNQDILARSGADIDMFNEFRRGSLGVLATQQAVDPAQVTYTPSPFADAFSTALQVGAQGMGNAYKSGGFGGAATTGSTVVGGDPWANLRQTTLPSTSSGQSYAWTGRIF